MVKMTKFIIFGAVVGLAVGYFLFAKVGGSYVNPLSLFLPPQGILDKMAGAVAGFAAIRNKVLLSGAAGAGVGLLGFFFSSRR